MRDVARRLSPNDQFTVVVVPGGSDYETSWQVLRIEGTDQQEDAGGCDARRPYVTATPDLFRSPIFARTYAES